MADLRRRTEKLTSLFALGLASGALFIACGGSAESSKGSSQGGDGGSDASSAGGTSSGAGSSVLDTGLDKDAAANDLTDAEVDQLCDASQAFVESKLSVEKTCSAAGAIAAFADPDNEGACEAARAECLADDSDGAVFANCAIPDECDITVGQYEACVSDQYAAFAPVLALIPQDCTTVSPEALLAAAFLLPQEAPASCAEVDEKCPGLVSDPTGLTPDLQVPPGTGGTGSGGTPASGGNTNLGGMAGAN